MHGQKPLEDYSSQSTMTEQVKILYRIAQQSTVTFERKSLLGVPVYPAYHNTIHPGNGTKGYAFRAISV